MATNKKSTKLEFATQCSTLAAGVIALPDKTITLSEQPFTPAEVAAPLQAYVTAAAQSAMAKAAYTKALQTEKAAEQAARAMFTQVKPFLQARFGKSNPVLQTTYGIAPEKAPQKSVAAKSEAIAKATTARKANHTMGPKQKKAAKQAAAQAPASPSQPATPAATSAGKPLGS